MLQSAHSHISWLASLREARSNCFTDVKPWNSAKRPWTKCLGCTKDRSWISIFVKSFQTPKLPNIKKHVDNLWITFRARRPAPGAQLTNPNSPKLLKNSRKLPKIFPDPAAGITCSSGCAAGPAVKLRNSRKKTKVSAIFVLASVRRHRARARSSRATFGIKTPENSQKFFEMHLDMLPGEGIYTRPGHKQVS